MLIEAADSFQYDRQGIIDHFGSVITGRQFPLKPTARHRSASFGTRNRSEIS